MQVVEAVKVCRPKAKRAGAALAQLVELEDEPLRFDLACVFVALGFSSPVVDWFLHLARLDFAVRYEPVPAAMLHPLNARRERERLERVARALPNVVRRVEG